MFIRNLFVTSLLVAAFASAIASAVYAQSSSKLRRILGRPATEAYQPEKDTVVTVSYDGEGKVCEVRLNGPFNKIQQLAGKLVPEDNRGRLLRSPESLLAMNCCDSFRFEYEKVMMTYFLGNKMDNYRFIFKGRVCVIPQPDVVTRRPGG